jgi:tetratricopeptide (TPR) repeat protein
MQQIAQYQNPLAVPSVTFAGTVPLDDGRLMTVAAVFLTYNEAHVLPRLLASIEPHVDQVIAIDGGSTDGSAELVRGVFGERCSLLRIDDTYMRKREQLMEWANGRADYLLLVDPDHELVVHGDLEPLERDAYMVTERQGTWRWRMPRLVKGDRVWGYAGGPCHEYLEAPTDQGVVDAWELIHHADSRPVEVKRETNLRELLAQTAANPDDARSQFYLGNAYMDQGRWAEAVEAYDRRLRMAGWDQELFCAMLYKGKCQLRMGLVGEAQWTFRWCAQRWPGRAEPLEWLRLTLPLADGLFVESDCYGERN